MTWVVDTCVLLDILDEIPPFAEAAAEALDVKSQEGMLAVAPITYVTRNEDDFRSLYPNLPIFNPVDMAT